MHNFPRTALRLRGNDENDDSTSDDRALGPDGRRLCLAAYFLRNVSRVTTSPGFFAPPFPGLGPGPGPALGPLGLPSGFSSTSLGEARSLRLREVSAAVVSASRSSCSPPGCAAGCGAGCAPGCGEASLGV